MSTLAGTYTSAEIVIIHNLRLPKFDKNRNVDQQKALVFQSETCKCDVILGADFFDKSKHWCQIQRRDHGMDREWIAIVQPLPSSNKEFEAIDEIIEVQQEDKLLGMD